MDTIIDQRRVDEFEPTCRTTSGKKDAAVAAEANIVLEATARMGSRSSREER